MLISKARLLAVANTMAYLATIVVNGLANGLPINGRTTGELSDLYPNLFVPAGFTFSIWGVIYLLLLIFIIYQFVIAFGQNRDKSLLNAIGPWFIISSVANSSWIIAWHYEFPGLSVIIMFILLFSLIKIYLHLQQVITEITAYNKYLIHPCFSIYLGWISVATIANITAVLVHFGWNGGFIDPASWTTIMILIASALGFYFSIFKQDPFYALVIVWALYGIYLKRSMDISAYEGIIMATQAGMFLCVLSILYFPVNKLFKSFQ